MMMASEAALLQEGQLQKELLVVAIFKVDFLLDLPQL
jgi:hypothetical protein